MSMNKTHDPALQSWVESANLPDADFPFQNLPFAVLRRRHSDEVFRVAVAIGDFALDLSSLQKTGLLSAKELDACVGHVPPTGRSIQNSVQMMYEKMCFFRI